jgi:hypothetical protein
MNSEPSLLQALWFWDMVWPVVKGAHHGSSSGFCGSTKFIAPCLFLSAVLRRNSELQLRAFLFLVAGTTLQIASILVRLWIQIQIFGLDFNFEQPFFALASTLELGDWFNVQI